MGTQDNLTTVLGVVTGVAIGSGSVETVALAGLAAGIAEAISMGGVLYTATRAESDMESARRQSNGAHRRRSPLRAALITFVAALVAAAIPLVPFLALPLAPAMAVSVSIALIALFGLGTWTARVTGQQWWRDGLRFVAIGGLAGLASALVGMVLRTNGI